MPRERKLTLRERVDAWVNKNARFGGEDDANQGYLAGWHARGRAERVTKDLVAAAVRYVKALGQNKSTQTIALCHLTNMVDALERAKAKGRK